mmetsp:Transcript_13955/g.20981  ORF Transcript_13955/g.20981 Transcript_13955/m.20981 type:complete len:450 (-) Transcript_13955:1322-2671(-)
MMMLRRSWNLCCSKKQMIARMFSSTSECVTLLWGDGTEAQLGHYPFERSGVLKTYQELSPRELTGTNIPIFTKISCGLNHTLAIDENGSVWSWGKSDYCKCGHGDDQEQPYPRKIEALAGVQAESVACGEYHSAVIDTEGRLYTWGWGGSWLAGGGHLGHGDRIDEKYPKLVSLLDDGGYRVSSVSCGEAHTLILTDDGEALSCGAGEHGRNGNASSADLLVPSPIPALDNTHVTMLEAGSAFSLALTKDHYVFVWGRNDQGQLGLGGGLAMDVYAMEDIPIKVEYRPGFAATHSEVDSNDSPQKNAAQDKEKKSTLIDSDAETLPLKATHVAAGHSHAAVVSTDGVLYYWGMKAHLEPVAPFFENGHIPTKVFAGGNYTHVLASDGSLHSFGQGRHNCLGHNNRQGLAHPKLITALNDYENITQVAAGFRHIAVLCSRRRPPPTSSSS